MQSLKVFKTRLDPSLHSFIKDKHSVGAFSNLKKNRVELPNILENVNIAKDLGSATQMDLSQYCVYRSTIIVVMYNLYM